MENNKKFGKDGLIDIDKTYIDQLIVNIKKYVNLFKALHHIDPAIAAEFKRKQDHFHSIKHREKNEKKEKKHQHETGETSTGCCGSKINSKSK